MGKILHNSVAEVISSNVVRCHIKACSYTEAVFTNFENESLGRFCCEYCTQPEGKNLCLCGHV